MTDLFDLQTNYSVGVLPVNGTVTEENITFLEKDEFENDIYKFEIDELSELSIDLDIIFDGARIGDTGGDDANLKLYRDDNNNGELDASDRLLANSVEIGDDLIRLEEAITNIYFARVEYFEGANDNRLDYQISFIANSIAEQFLPHSNLVSLGSLSPNETINKFFLLDKDLIENEIFTFELNENSNLNITLDITNSDDDANLRLFRDTNNNGELDPEDQAEIIDTQTFRGDDSISKQELAAGNYLILVNYVDGGNDNAVDYDLILSANKIEQPPITSSVINGISLSTLPPGQSIEENSRDLSPNRTVTDLYSFELEQLGNLKIDLNILSNIEGDLNLELIEDSNDDGQWDDGDRSIILSHNPGDDSIDETDLSAGKYFARVPINHGTNDTFVQYNLIFDYEPFLPFLRTIDLGTLSVDGTSVKQNNSLEEESFENDIYKFEINEAGDFNITLDITDSNDDGDLGLFRDTNNNGELDPEDRDGLIIKSESTGDDSITNQRLSAGDYFAVVTYIDGGDNDSLNYELDVSARSFTNEYDKGNQFSTPFFRFRNTQLGNNSTYIYVGEEEKNAILNDPDFSRTFELEGRVSGQDVPAFIARVTPGSDLVPINRYRNTNTSTGTYLFSTEEDFQQDSRIDQENFFNEGLAFYAYPPSSGSGSNFSRFENSGLPDTFVFQGAVEAANTRQNFPGFIDKGETWAVETL